MAGFIKVDVEKFPTHQMNLKVDKEAFHGFKVKCRQRGIPMNVVLEVFMNQYASGEYPLDKEKIDEQKYKQGETETLNTPVNKDVHNRFKNIVKEDGMLLKYVVAAFIQEYATNDLEMRFVIK